MKHVSHFLFAIIFVSSCKEHRPDEPFVIDTGNDDTVAVDDKTYKGFRLYQGKIPCADCAGIEQQLFMKGDSLGIYRLKEVYKQATEDGDSELISNGEWKRMKNGSSYIYYLSEKNIGDSIRIMRYQIEGDNIVMMDTYGDSIRSASNYKLKLVRKE